jgi:hypothetical protein
MSDNPIDLSYTLGYERGEKETINRLLNDACIHGNVHVVRFLLGREKPTELDNAIEYAIAFGHEEIIGLLYKHMKEKEDVR